MEKQRGIKALSIVALLIAVVGLTVAFAAMSRTLTINGTATMDTAKWDIHFENLSTPKAEDDTLLGAAEVLTAPTIEEANGFASTHIGDYSVKLTKPGDTVVYTFDVKNAGDINATLGTYTKAKPVFTGTGATAAADEAIVEANLIYTLTYLDGTEINVDDTLNGGESKTLKLTVAYDSEATELPTADVEISGMDVTMIYNQA